MEKRDNNIVYSIWSRDKNVLPILSDILLDRWGFPTPQPSAKQVVEKSSESLYHLELTGDFFMALRRIFIYPEEVLKKRANEITSFDDSIKKLAEDMAETMYAAPGVGLAAPQVGESKRLVVIDAPIDEEKTTGLLKLVNPELVAKEGKIEYEEGCLSLPELYEKVTRFSKVVVKAIDLNTEREIKLEAEGVFAIALQHEIDHLNGVLFIDHLSPLKKKLAIKRFKKIVEERKKEVL